MKSNPVENLFPEEIITGNTETILDVLGRHSVRNLAYGGVIGRNPGHIFRGEAAFDCPLQSSLERSAREKLGDNVLIDGEALRLEEVRQITNFIEGQVGRFAAIFYPHSKDSFQHPKHDVFWCLSLMQHYGLPTRLLDFTLDIRMALYFAIEQHDRHRKHHGVVRDLIIYCFPSKNLKFQNDPDNNKSPFRFSRELPAINMNVAIGCLMKLSWMQAHETLFKKHLENRNQQTWGWDGPYYQNPRLESQRGMFVYPYDYPGTNGSSGLEKNGQSWFAQNLNLKTTDQFNLGSSVASLPPKRIRIESQHADSLREHLKEQYGISKDTIYERYAL